MIALLAATALAAPLELELNVALPEGEATWMTLEDVTPGMPRMVSFPCGKGSSCKAAVTVSACEGKWMIDIELYETWRGWLGRPHTELLGRPRFLVPEGELAEIHIGSTDPIGSFEAPAWRTVGLHLQARVVADGEG